MPELERYEAEGILVRASDVDSFVDSLKKMIDFSNIKPKLIKYEYVNLDHEQQEESIKLLKNNGYSIDIENEDAIGVLDENS